MRALLAVAVTFMLAACGFSPMYASPTGESAIGPVQVTSIEGKAGHVLKTELDRMLRVEAADGGPPALLDIALTESVSQLGIRLDESASRAELRLTAAYVLTPAAPGAAPITGRLSSVVNYEIPLSAFGEIAAQDDARERAAETLAQNMRAELAMRISDARQGRAP